MDRKSIERRGVMAWEKIEPAIDRALAKLTIEELEALAMLDGSFDKTPGESTGIDGVGFWVRAKAADLASERSFDQKTRKYTRPVITPNTRA